MVIHCREVWREISNYLDDSTRNVLLLIADERVFPLPVGFSERLRKRLDIALEIRNT
jgi:hypothetical protein